MSNARPPRLDPAPFTLSDTLATTDTASCLDPSQRPTDRAYVHVAHCPEIDRRGAVHLLTRQTTVGRRRGASPSERAIEFDDRRISANHFEIRPQPHDFALCDPGSRNGTWVNGARVWPDAVVALGDGDVIRAGNTVMVFRYGDPPPSVTDDSLLPGRAPGISAARAYIGRIAALGAHLLVLGETGTGKEYAARATHQQGDRPDNAFVPVNCGELSKGLARAELFGAEAGAFTDARKTRPGLVATAKGGTLFLDEIGDLELSVQVELIRFLEDGTYRRVGGQALARSDARVVAATNVDVEAAVDTGRFRLDLLARLRSHLPPVWLPPLRDRREDLLWWVGRFIHDSPTAMVQGPAEWSAGFAESVLVYAWPENLRELRMAVGAALLARSDDRPLGATDLPAKVAAARREARKGVSAATTGGSAGFEAAAPPITRERVIDALEKHQGVVVRAARELGIDRRKLYRLCRRFDLDYEDFRSDPQAQ